MYLVRIGLDDIDSSQYVKESHGVRYVCVCGYEDCREADTDWKFQMRVVYIDPFEQATRSVMDRSSATLLFWMTTASVLRSRIFEVEIQHVGLSSSENATSQEFAELLGSTLTHTSRLA